MTVEHASTVIIFYENIILTVSFLSNGFKLLNQRNSCFQVAVWTLQQSH